MTESFIRKSSGYTLVEVILALGLSLVTLSVLYSVYVNQLKAQVVREQMLDAQQRARVVIDLVSREVLMAGYDPAGINVDADPGNDFQGVVADADGLHIKADLNGNGWTHDPNESILFSHDPSTQVLRRNTGGGNQPFGEDIESFQVKLLNQQGNQAESPLDVRQVELRVAARSQVAEPGHIKNGGIRTITLISRVTPRNLLR